MIKYPDMVVGSTNGKEGERPNRYKVFLFAGTDSQITQHECLYEGKAAYEKLYDHVIIGQITIDGGKYKGIEHTPIVNAINPLKYHVKLLNSSKLWRFMNLSKFEDLIHSRTLHYARIDQFEDKLEGISPFSSIRAILDDNQRNEEQKRETFDLYKARMDNNRKVSFACCWHINEEINFSLWNEYGENSHESIAIQTNVRKINKIVKDTGFPVLNEAVRYFDEPYFNQNAYWFPTLFKRSAYQKEREFRSILFVYGVELPGLKIRINMEEFISKIYIHPKASKEFYKKIRIFIKNKGLHIPVAQIRP